MKNMIFYLFFVYPFLLINPDPVSLIHSAIFYLSDFSIPIDSYEDDSMVSQENRTENNVIQQQFFLPQKYKLQVHKYIVCTVQQHCFALTVTVSEILKEGLSFCNHFQKHIHNSLAIVFFQFFVLHSKTISSGLETHRAELFG